MNITSNGICLHVSDRGQGSLAVVLLHGWGCSTRTWDHVIAALPPGYRTVAIDQRGWGSSEHPTGGYSLAELADDTEGAIKGGRIDIPTLVISGEYDKIDRVEDLKRELLPRIPGAVLEVLPGVGHLSLLEAPEEIARYLDAFAQGFPSGREVRSRVQSPSLQERDVSIAMSERIALPREIAGIRIPDSALAQKAMDLAFRVSPTVVWTHVVRTFVFGALVGRAQNLRYDEELFFLASVLHDLGLTAEFRGAQRFEVVGADAADAFLKDQGVRAERREIIWDAIALHTSVGIASRKRPEIALVHIGAGVDVVGLELDKLPPELVAQTIETLPRHDFNKAFFSILVDTIAQAPQSAAMTWMCETANEYVPGCHCPTFAEKLKTSPFRE
jgi:hypothetical protein